MTTFADSSALVKLYVPEAGVDLVRASADTIVCSALAQVEVVAALWRKHRRGEVSAEDAAVLAAAFLADLRCGEVHGRALIAVDVTAAVLDEAAVMAARHGLRGYDAVQLATAVVVRPHVDTSLTFACFDDALATAATIEGFVGLPAPAGDPDR